jgi:hypothetical protein
MRQTAIFRTSPGYQVLVQVATHLMLDISCTPVDLFSSSKLVLHLSTSFYTEATYKKSRQPVDELARLLAYSSEQHLTLHKKMTTL